MTSCITALRYYSGWQVDRAARALYSGNLRHCVSRLSWSVSADRVTTHRAAIHTSQTASQRHADHYRAAVAPRRSVTSPQGPRPPLPPPDADWSSAGHLRPIVSDDGASTRNCSSLGSAARGSWSADYREPYLSCAPVNIASSVPSSSSSSSSSCCEHYSGKPSFFSSFHGSVITSSLAWKWSIVMSVFVCIFACLCVCVSASISLEYTRPIKHDAFPKTKST